MTYPSLIDSLDHFKNYLESNDPNADLALDAFLETYKNKRNDAIRDFHLVPIGEAQIIKPTLKLFESLKVDHRLWFLYFNPKLSVYQFLKELDEKTNSPKLKYLLNRIDARTARSKRQLFFMGLFAIGVALAAYFIPPIYALLTAAMDLTIAGLVYTTTVALLRLRQNHYGSQIKTRFDKWRDTFFLTGSTVLNLAAYGLWIGEKATMNPLIAGLFVGAAAMEAAREVFVGIQNYVTYLEEKKEYQRTPKAFYAENSRLKYTQNINLSRLYFEYKKNQTAAAINFTAALILAGLIAAWCLLPGSALTTLGIVAAIVVVHATKNFFNKCNQSRNKVKLSAALEKIHENDVAEEKLKRTKGPSRCRVPSSSLTASIAFPNMKNHPPMFRPDHSPMLKRASFRKGSRVELQPDRNIPR